MNNIHFTLLNILISGSQGTDAYLDPGSGSYLIQLLLASLLGGLFLVRLYWKKITGFFTRKKNPQDRDENGVDDENQ